MSIAGQRASLALLADFRGFAGRRLAVVLLLVVVGALAESIGIVMLLPILSAFNAGKATPGPDFFSSRLEAADDGHLLLAALGGFVLLMLLRGAALYLRDVRLQRLVADYQVDLQLRVVATLAGHGWQRAVRIGQARVQSLLGNDVPRVGLAIHFAQNLFVAGLMLSVQTAVALAVSPRLAALAAAIVIIGLLLSWHWLGRAARSGRAITAGQAESSAASYRLLSALKQALAQGQAVAFIEELGASLRRLAAVSIDYVREQARARTIASCGAALAAAALIYAGLVLLELPMAVLATMMLLFARMLGPAQQIQQASQMFAGHVPAFAAVGELLGPLRRELALPAAGEALAWQRLAGDGIGYRHSSGGGVGPLSFTLDRGEWLGIAGPSGAGKTTLIDLVARLLEPTQGRLAVDGAEAGAGSLAAWQRQLAYCGQDSLLFSGSVRENLAWGTVISDDRLWQLLDLVGAEALVRAMPGGLDAAIGERGALLSGGERQRLGLARALGREPLLLLLDEATSALDVAAERQIFARLRSCERRAAAIIVAHRQETLEQCDRLITIDGDGRLVP